MYLSIHTIFNLLPYTEKMLHVTENKIIYNLKNVRQFTNQQTGFSPELLYIVSADQICFLGSTEGINIVCNGFIYKSNTIPNPESVISFSERVDTFELLETLQNIFDYYNNWYESISQSIITKKPLNEIFEECAKIFRNPITLFDNSHFLILKSNNIPTEVKDPLWAYVLKYGYSPKTTPSEQDQLYNMYTTTTEPFYYQSKDQFHKSKRLIVALHHNHSLIGSIATTDLCAPIDSFEYANMHYAQDIMEKALINSDEFNILVSPTPHYVIQLLRGDYVDNSIIEYNLAPKQKLIHTPFRLLCFRSLKALDSMDAFKNCIPNFIRNFHTDFIYLYDNQIIVIEYSVHRYHDSEFIDSMNDFLSLNQFKGTGSMVYDNFTNLHSSYLQAQETLNTINSNKSSFYLFEDLYSSYVLKTIKNNTPFECLLYPQLKQVLKKEKTYAMELLLCLETFIFNGLNATKTSEVLFLHRHTVLYRINILTQITGIDFSTLDQNSLFQIYLSCKLMIYSLKQ